MAILRGSRRALPRALLSVAAGTLLLGAGSSTAAAQVVPLDLLNRIGALESGAAGTASTLSTLTARTAADGSLLTVHDGRLTDLESDVGGLRTSLATVDTALNGIGARVATDIADLRVQVGDLRGLLDGIDVSDIIDVTGPVDAADLVATLNRQIVSTAANATNLAKLDVSLAAVQTGDARQDLRLDDHERRIARNTDDIRRQDLAIAGLQSEMASGFAGVDDELRHQSRRIDKATEGVAMAMAMKSPAVPEAKNFALSGSFGAFEGRTALAFAGGVRATDALQFDAGVAVGLEGGSVGGRAGATLAW